MFGNDKSLRETWCMEQGGNELYQGAHRLRFVRNPGRILIVHGGYYPVQLFGPATTTIDMRERDRITDFDIAIERAIEFIEECGVISKRYCWLLGIGHNSECEKIQKIKQRFMAEVAKATSIKTKQPLDVLIRYIILTDQEVNLVFSDTAFWTNFWEELQRCIPCPENIEVKHADIDKRNYTKAYGTIDAGTKLDALFAELGFEPGIWKSDAQEATTMEREQETEIDAGDKTKITINIPAGTSGPVTVNLNVSFREKIREHAANQAGLEDDAPTGRHLHLVRLTEPQAQK